ncbi:DinB family protein [Paenibacillus pinistramenti]|uniref:DinB family protein n=1 Tax=Paenibacillus pinistramenti TaxID=1768003 RepID=UPI001107BFD0|nr:DinB family protein [Paenibacillus pinistramenti]
MKTIQTMYEHLNWANQRILETLQSMEEQNQELNRLFLHILFAEQVWITRLRGLDSTHLPIWPETGADTDADADADADVEIEACAELVRQNKESTASFLAELSNADLDKRIAYTNSKGQEFENSVRDILTHAALHGHYHRGQINLRLRAAGYEPANIDFITFVR